MSDVYRDRFDLGEFAIEISLVDENDGVHVEVWPDFEQEERLPPGLKDAIEAWCKTPRTQDWAVAQNPGPED